jgi:hypothetical protein
MCSKHYLSAADALRREARAVWALAGGDSPKHTQLVACARELERLAAVCAREENQAAFRGQSFAAWQRQTA